MSIQYENLNDYGISFKHLISGPAPVGRILNYLILTGKGVLKHKNGNRDLNLFNNIASAWCSEFMVGLGLVYYNEDRNSVYQLYLTDNGKKLYELIKNHSPNFDESPDPTNCRQELITYNKDAFDLFFNIFKSSPVCKNLCKYIANAGKYNFPRDTFKDDYFECFKLLYEGGTYNRLSRTTTAANRVPSLLQLCEFFSCLQTSETYFIFDYKKLSTYSTEVKFINIDKNIIDAFEKEEKKQEIVIKDLIEKYGIDGTVAQEVVVRNSKVQEIFRNNLIARYGCKCAICNKNIDKVLIASHIVPSSECNVLDKANCENGLLLCAMHDKLFDKYLISFSFDTGLLLYSEALKDKLEEYQLSEGFCLDEKYLTDERKTFLLKHNLEFYERNK